jgi:nucleoid-associated protein YgaU
MGLEKLTIRVETGETITALFNPNQITIAKTANWRCVPSPEHDVPPTQFTSGEPATLSLDLFFDTYDSRTSGSKTDVRVHTDKVFSLTTVQGHGGLHRPPTCELSWGRFVLSDFQWVLRELTQRFTLFLENGTPVRATLSCEFQQWRGDEVEAALLNLQSVDVFKRRVVRRGETLSGIAAEEYNDPTLWRAIALRNRIDNPRVLQPGRRLTIPSHPSRGGR